MKKLHIIHAKSLDAIPTKYQGKTLPLLEKETLDWAKQFNSEAYSATLEMQKEYEKNPSAVNGKYFKYLRRLLELKLKELEKQPIPRENKNQLFVAKDLMTFLDIDAFNVPEYLSCTQISMYEFCPRKYFFRYVLGIEVPKTAALHFGSSVDEALNFYFQEKIKGQTPPLSAVHAQFYETFDKGKEGVVWGKAKPEQLYKNGPEVINTYINTFDKVTNPTGVQTEVIIPFEDGGYLKGFIDILEEHAVVDTKTAAKPWEATGKYAKHLSELQPKAYSLWFWEHFDRIPKEFRYQIVTKDVDEDGNATPKTQLIRFEVKKFELESFKLRIQRIWRDIMAAIPKGKSAFIAQADPSARGSEPGMGIGKQKLSALCTKEWCEYASLCKADGLKIPVKWVSKTEDKPGHHVYEEDLPNEEKANKPSNS